MAGFVDCDGPCLEMRPHRYWWSTQPAQLRKRRQPLVLGPIWSHSIRCLHGESESQLLCSLTVAVVASWSVLEHAIVQKLTACRTVGREQADGILADADSPAVTRWTMGRETSDGEDSALGYLEDQSGFGQGNGPVGYSSTRTGGVASKHSHMTQNRGADESRATTPRLSAADSASLFADFDFNGLETVRDAYGRDITPVKARDLDTGDRGVDGVVQRFSLDPAAPVAGGGAASIGVKVKARASQVPAQTGHDVQAKSEHSSKGGGANYACTAEC